MKLMLFVSLWLFKNFTFVHDKLQTGSELVKIIIYRQKEFGGRGYGIYINDKKVGALTPNHYFELDLPPGRTKIESGKDYYTDPQTVWLTLRAGQVYYVKAVEEMDFLKRTLLLAPVSSEQGKQETRRIKRSVITSPQPD